MYKNIKTDRITHTPRYLYGIKKYMILNIVYTLYTLYIRSRTRVGILYFHRALLKPLKTRRQLICSAIRH